MIDALSKPLEFIVQLFFRSLFQLLRSLITFILDSTEPEIFVLNNEDGSRANFFQEQFILMWEISIYVMIPLVMAATINAVLKGGMRQVLNLYLVGVPISIFGGVACLALVGMAQAINQNMVDYFDDSAAQNLELFLARIDGFTEVYTAYVGLLFMGGILGVGMMLGIIALTVELIAREITIYMSVLFMPLAFAGYVWPATRKWLLNMIELTLAMVFAKGITVAVLSLGFAALLSGLSDGGAGSQITALAMGALIMIAAAFTMPVLVGMALAPNSAPPLNRQDVQNVNPWNSTRKFNRGQYTGALKGLRRGGGGNVGG